MLGDWASLCREEMPLKTNSSWLSVTELLHKHKKELAQLFKEPVSWGSQQLEFETGCVRQGTFDGFSWTGLSHVQQRGCVLPSPGLIHLAHSPLGQCPGTGLGD